MSLRRKAAAFFQLSSTDHILICEAVLMLAAARVCVLTVPLRVLAGWLARAPDTGLSDPELVRQIGRAVAIAARNVPWNAVCLPQAMAAKAMLALRGLGSAFRLGATIEGNGQVSAHAWLECNGQIVIGAEGVRGMSHLARFG